MEKELSVAEQELAKAHAKVLEEREAQLEKKIEEIKEQVKEKKGEVIGLYRGINVEEEDSGCFGGGDGKSNHLHLGVINGELEDRKGQDRSILGERENLFVLVNSHHGQHGYHYSTDLVVPAKRIVSVRSPFEKSFGFNMGDFKNAKDGELGFGREEVALASGINLGTEFIKMYMTSPCLVNFELAIGDESSRELLKRIHISTDKEIDIMGLLKDDALYEREVGDYQENQRMKFAKSLVIRVGEIALADARVGEIEGTVMSTRLERWMVQDGTESVWSDGDVVREYEELRNKLISCSGNVREELVKAKKIGLEDMRNGISGSVLGIPAEVTPSHYLEYVNGFLDTVNARLRKIDEYLTEQRKR